MYGVDLPPTSIDVENGKTMLSNVIVGMLIMVLSSFICFVYVIILRSICKDNDLMKLTSYRFMFLLGIFDVFQCFPHFITGIFTIFQSVGHPTFAKILGAIATPCYVGYTVMTLILALQRFIKLVSHKWEERLFNRIATFVWIIIAICCWLTFVVFLSLPTATIRYNPNWYNWDYDDDLPFSSTIQTIEMYTEITTIGCSGVLYFLVVIFLLKKRQTFASSANHTAEIKILIQAVTITTYSLLMNTIWHHYRIFLPENIWSYMVLNLMWVISPAVYPAIYIIVNRLDVFKNCLICRSIRDQVIRKTASTSRINALRENRSTLGSIIPSINSSRSHVR